MRRQVFNVTVNQPLTGAVVYSPGDTDHAWATSVTIDRKGNLRVWEGHQVRVFHKPHEWTGYEIDKADPPATYAGVVAPTRPSPTEVAL